MGIIHHSTKLQREPSAPVYYGNHNTYQFQNITSNNINNNNSNASINKNIAATTDTNGNINNQSPISSTSNLSNTPSSSNNSHTHDDFRKSRSYTASSSQLKLNTTYEFYGYAIYLVSFIALGIWIIWAYFQDSVIESIGFTYYPNKYWALAIPVYIMAIVVFIVLMFISYNLIHTPSFQSLNTITDEYSTIMKNVKYTRLEEDDDIPELQDLPISVVNAYLYSDSSYSSSDPYSYYSLS